MRPERNPYLARIGSVESFVRAHRSPDQSLENLAHRLGVNRIAAESLPFEGGVFELPGGELVIKINSQSSVSRKRFTLAHEIAHLLLDSVPAFRKAQGTDAALERACDAIAAELLIPTGVATNFVRGLGQPSPENLRRIAREYSVSLQTAAIRVHSDFKLWKCCIGCWERQPRIRTAWFVGQRRWSSVEPDAYALDLALASEDSVKVEEWWQKGPSAQPVSLMLQRLDEDRVLGLVGFVN